MAVLRRVGGYELDDDPDRVDRERVWRFLSRHAYGLYARFGFAGPDATYLERPARH